MSLRSESLQPHRQGRGIEHAGQALDLLAEPARIIGKFGHLLALAGQRPQPQGGKPAGRAPVGLDEFIAKRAHADIEGRSRSAACRRCSRRNRFGRFRIEPGFEIRGVIRRLREPVLRPACCRRCVPAPPSRSRQTTSTCGSAVSAASASLSCASSSATRWRAMRSRLSHAPR